MASSSREEIVVQCRCGQLRGGFQPSSRSQRVVCYCRTCQAFAHFLGRPELLDAQGGSHIVQSEPHTLRFHQGSEHLACMRLSDKGLLRWYASCCQTPLGNTPALPSFAFVGLLAA
ncbi:MAG: DUF6151 family protein, partial [Myxococcota bacterium]